MRLIIYFVLILSVFGCHSTAPDIAFYHWKKEVHLSSAETAYLKNLDVQKLYLRFFDVDWDPYRQVPVPISTANISMVPNFPATVIPTIFITNRSFLEIKNNDIPNFVNKTLSKIKSIQKTLTNVNISEIQIDCDWNGASKENYFQFLEILKKELKKEKKKLSVTIRLHQLKYPEKTGIPPADRGALMCYNVGDLQDWETENSILDDQITATYLKNNMTYGLPLDIALPTFNWGVLFRDGAMIKLLNQLEASELSDQNFYTNKKKNRYEVKQSTYLHGHYLYPGDQIRLEAVSENTLKVVSQQLKQAFPSQIQTLIFYHLDSLAVANYPVAEIKEIQRIFGEVE